MANNKKLKGCLIGLAVGDALGCTLEFKKPGTFESTQPEWETHEYIIQGNIAPIIGTSRCDNYAVHPNNR